MNKYKIDYGIVVAAGGNHLSSDRYNLAVIADWAAKKLITVELVKAVEAIPFKHVMLFERNRTGQSSTLSLEKEKCLGWLKDALHGIIQPHLLATLPDNPSIPTWNNQDVFVVLEHIVSTPLIEFMQECKQYDYRALLELRKAMKKLYLESEGLNRDALFASDKVKAVMNAQPMVPQPTR